MKTLNKLNFNENLIVMEKKNNDDFEMVARDRDNSDECSAKVNCRELKLNEFVLDWFYSEILHPELNYFFEELLSDEERLYVDCMGLDSYVSYLNNKFKETDTATMNGLYEVYIKLNEYINSNILNREIKCVLINTAESYNEDNTGLSLILNKLKEDFELIISYSNDDLEGYWLDIASFKELINYNLFWTSNKKLNEIL